MELRYPAAGPAWLRDFGASVVRLFKGLMDAPFRLWPVATVDLPTAADFSGGLAWNLTVSRITYSNGSAWVEVQPYDATLAALAALDATPGILVQTGADTFTKRTLAAPAAGITITNPAGTAGNPTFALANDLAALEGLGSTGIAVRTGADTWAQRTITGTANRLTVTNGDGVAANPTLDISTAYVGQATITTLGTITTGTWQGTTVGVGFGGTGLTSYAVGDLLYASASNVLSKLADVATGNVLISGGVTIAPSWGKVGLTTHVSGILPGANGGTNNGFMAFSGPATSLKTFTLPNASDTIACLGTIQTFTAAQTYSAQQISTMGGSTTNPQIFLNGGTNNWIGWSNNGLGDPAFTTRSAGGKLVLWNALSGSSGDYGFGVNGGVLWASVPTNGDTFKWFGGTTLAASLSGAGALTFASAAGTGDVSTTGGAMAARGQWAGTTGNGVTAFIDVASGVARVGSYNLASTWQPMLITASSYSLLAASLGNYANDAAAAAGGVAIAQLYRNGSFLMIRVA